MSGPPIRFSRLNFLVGANASGKTNVLRALRFLQNSILQNVELAVDAEGGLTEVRNKILREKKEAKPLTLRVKFSGLSFDVGSKSGGKYSIDEARYELKLDVRSESGVPAIESEALEAKLSQGGKPLPNYSLRRDREHVEIHDPLSPVEKPERRFPIPAQEASRAALGVVFFSLPCVILRSEMESWSFFNINPQTARAPFRDVADARLGSSGEYLSVVLHRIEKENGKGSLASIIAGLKGAIPGFKSIKTTQLPVENKWAFQLLEDRIRGAINPESASDGTIRLLALMVIAQWSSRHSSLLAIEEPENGLHPHLSEHIVSILRAASTDRQIIATTHNPDFLDFLEPEEVQLCDKEEGFTKIRIASDQEEVTTFKRRFRLGELWEQGVLGGIP